MSQAIFTINVSGRADSIQFLVTPGQLRNLIGSGLLNAEDQQRLAQWIMGGEWNREMCCKFQKPKKGVLVS